MLPKPLIGVMLGDATGIGPELIAKLFVKTPIRDMCRPVILGDSRVLRQGMRIAQADFPLRLIGEIDQAEFGEAIDVLDTMDIDPQDYTLGKACKEAGHAAFNAMSLALSLLQAKKLDGAIYGPNNKVAFKLAGYSFDDGLEIVKNAMTTKGVCGEINVIEGLWSTRVTSHIPYSDVPKSLSTDKIVRVIRFSDQAIRASGLDNPRIAVAGLNPHNGEEGLCGREEVEIIAPAVVQAKQEGINVFGPFSADALFRRAYGGEFDLIISMYHDQGQIAMKLRDFADIITLAGGLPFPLATPAHGTAFDIVGKGVAEVNPTYRALEMVCRIAVNQAKKS